MEIHVREGDASLTQDTTAPILTVIYGVVLRKAFRGR